jgi:hypothetical protein
MLTSNVPPLATSNGPNVMKSFCATVLSFSFSVRGVPPVVADRQVASAVFDIVSHSRIVCWVIAWQSLQPPASIVALAWTASSPSGRSTGLRRLPPPPPPPGAPGMSANVQLAGLIPHCLMNSSDLPYFESAHVASFSPARSSGIQWMFSNVR